MPKKDPSIPTRVTDPKLKKGIKDNDSGRFGKNFYDIQIIDYNKCCDKIKSGPKKGKPVKMVTYYIPSKDSSSEKPLNTRIRIRACIVNGKMTPQSVMYPKKGYELKQKRSDQFQSPYLVAYNKIEDHVSKYGAYIRKSGTKDAIIIPKKDGLRFVVHGGKTYTLGSCLPIE